METTETTNSLRSCDTCGINSGNLYILDNGETYCINHIKIKYNESN